MIATACLLVHGCETVEGGAVELSWKLRPASSELPDKFVECRSGEPDTNAVTAMRLTWQVRTEDGREEEGVDEWPCVDNHGVTGFDLPAGTALLSVDPVCSTGELSAPGSYISPAAEQRRVNVGETVSLGAVELVVVVTSCAQQPCICE